MEFLNKIEARGIVGRITVETYNGARVARFSLYTEYAYKDRSGAETSTGQWFNVTAWDSQKGNQIDGIQRGDFVYTLGRLQLRKYTRDDGSEGASVDIIASQVKLEGKAREQ